jgi:hypothetical protein
VIKVLRRALRQLAAQLGFGGRGQCTCPGCDEIEQIARAAIGMPARHPERLIGGLPDGQDGWLAAAAAALWPHDEYARIITDTRRQDRP